MDFKQTSIMRSGFGAKCLVVKSLENLVTWHLSTSHPKVKADCTKYKNIASIGHGIEHYIEGYTVAHYIVFILHINTTAVPSIALSTDRIANILNLGVGHANSSVRLRVGTS